MKNNETVSLQKDPKSIQLELQISKQRLAKGKNQQFQPPKKMEKLLKALTFKNQKIQSDRIMKRLDQNSDALMDLNNQENFKAFADQEISRAAKRPFEQRNQLAQFQSDKKRNLNTYELFEVNEKIKTAAKNSVLLQKLKNQKIQQTNRELQDSKDRRIGISNSLMKQIKKGTNQELILQQGQQDFEIQFIPQEVFLKSKRMTDRTDLILLKNFESKSIDKQICSKLLQIALPLKVSSKQKVFCLFMDLLEKKISAAKALNCSISEHSLRQLAKDYYENHANMESKVNSHVSVKIWKLKNQINFVDKNEYDLNLTFWCKCLTFFFSMECGKDKLIQQLEKSDFKHFIDPVNAFFQGNMPLNPNSLIKTMEYQHNIFYRIFVKILLQEQFAREQIDMLKEEERRIVLKVQLKYWNEYHRMKGFNDEREVLISSLNYCMLNQKPQQTQKVLQRMIEVSQFDKIYFSLFANGANGISHLKNLFLLKVFLDNPGLLDYSIYSLKDWVRQCIQKLTHLLLTSNTQNSRYYTKAMTEMLVRCQPILGQQNIIQILQEFMKQNKLLIEDSFSVDLIRSKFNIQWKTMETLLIDSINKNDDYVRTIQKYLGIYINFKDKEFSAAIPIAVTMSFLVHQTQQKLNEPEIKSFQSKIQNLLSLKVHETQSINRFFILGLKLFAGYLVKCFTKELQVFSRDELQKYLFRHKVTMKKIKHFLILLKQISTLEWSKGLDIPQRVQKRDEIEELIEEIENLIEICEFFTYFIYLNEYANEQGKFEKTMSIAVGLEEFLTQKQGVKMKLCRIFGNMEYLKIIDETFGYSMLLKQLDTLFKTIDRNVSGLSRKRSPQYAGGNFGFILEFIRISMELIASKAEINERCILASNREKIESLTRNR